MPTGEAQTDPIIRQAMNDGKIIYVPRIMRDSPDEGATKPVRSYMDFFRIYSQDDFDTGLVPGVWGIREPNSEVNNAPRATIFDGQSHGVDLILMPGMAFDDNLARLGHGKGYYDSFIARYLSIAKEREWPRPTLIGLSLEEQVVESGLIPMVEHDVHLDALITSR